MSDFVTLYLPWVYPWSWMLFLWGATTLFLRWWETRVHSQGAVSVREQQQNRGRAGSLKVLAQVLLSVVVVLCLGLLTVILTRVVGPIFLVLLVAAWWVYYGLGFMRPRSRRQRLADHAAAIVLFCVAFLFHLYLRSAGPSYFLERLQPEGPRTVAYLERLARTEQLSEAQLSRYLQARDSRLRSNSLSYLERLESKPPARVVKQVRSLQENDRELEVRQRAEALLQSWEL